MNKRALYPVGTKLRCIQDNPSIGGNPEAPILVGDVFTVIGHDSSGDPILDIPGADHASWFFAFSVSSWFEVAV